MKQIAGIARGSNRRRRAPSLFAAMISATISPCAIAAVGQHRLAGQVADRPDVAHRGAALVVDPDGAAGHVERQRFEAEAVGARLAADGDQDLVGGDFGSVATCCFDRHGTRAVVVAGDLRS